MDTRQCACGVVVALAIVAQDVGRPVLAQVTQALTFVRPAVQGPGTPGYGVISDPTIQPYVAPGIPARLNLSTLVDLRGNGQPDIFGCHGSSPPYPAGLGPCRVLRPQPDGSVIDITRQLFGPGPLPSVMWGREIVSGDFNRDGRPDIFVADYGYDGPPWPGHTNLLLLSNANGTYTDRSSTLPQVPDSPHSATVGDINGDGFLDIYVGNVDRPPAPYFLMGLGDGTFTQKTTGLPAMILQERYMTSLLVDLDGDGHQDLALGSVSGNFGHNIVLYNDGTGDFTARPRVLLPQGPLPANDFYTQDLVAFDVNRDLRPDLMVLSSLSHADIGVGLQVLINHGGGAFVDETTTRLPGTTPRASGWWSPFIQFADLNGDGWQDFYLDTVQHEDGVLHERVWLNSGSNTWTPMAPSSLPPEFGHSAIFAVDFDGDGRPDILQVGGIPLPGPDFGYRSFLNRTLAPPRTLTSTTSGPVVTLAWQGSVGATSYRLEAGSAPGLSNLFAGNVGPAPAFSTAPPVGTYYVRVRAVNAQGTSAPSNEVVVLVAGCAPPAMPLGVSSAVAGTQVALTWSAAAGAASYTVQVGTLPGATNVFDGNVGATTAVSGNLPSGLYFLRAFAVNACGAGPVSATVDATVVCASLSPPGAFTATASGRTVTMQWAAAPSATSYVLEAGISPNISNVFVGSVGPGTSLVAPNIPPGAYRVRVRASSACGVSGPSNTVTVVVS